MSKTIKAVSYVQSKTINQLLEEYKIPLEVRNARLRHGEPLMNKDLLYEAVMQGSNAAVFQSILDSSNTFYRDEVYFSLPASRDFVDTTEEMILVNTESKHLHGPYCPGCGKTNTMYLTDQERGCDEGYTVYIICRSCNGRFKNPTNIRFPEK